MADGIGGHEGAARVRSARKIRGLPVPAGHVVKDAARLAENVGSVSLLGVVEVRVADERRVADDVVQIGGGYGFGPIDA